MPKRIAIIGAGISGLGVAWALNKHPDRFDFRLYEANDRIGGNAVTFDMPQADGTSIPFDISVTACIPRVYHHIVQFMKQHNIELIDTKFSYSVKYHDEIYAHDLDSKLRRKLQPEIVKFQRVLKFLKTFNCLNRSRSTLLAMLNPFNYVSMGAVLNWGKFSGDFRYKVLKPMFVNFLMATNVFDMPAALFSYYLEFFDIERATPMKTWDQGTRRIYEAMSAEFKEKILLNCAVRKVYRRKTGVLVEDEEGHTTAFDEVVFACNANQTFMILDKPTRFETYLLSTIRYESELHNHTNASSLGCFRSAGERGPTAGNAQQSDRAIRSQAADEGRRARRRSWRPCRSPKICGLLNGGTICGGSGLLGRTGLLPGSALQHRPRVTGGGPGSCEASGLGWVNTVLSSLGSEICAALSCRILLPLPAHQARQPCLDNQPGSQQSPSSNTLTRPNCISIR